MQHAPNLFKYCPQGCLACSCPETRSCPEAQGCGITRHVCHRSQHCRCIGSSHQQAANSLQPAVSSLRPASAASGATVSCHFGSAGQLASVSMSNRKPAHVGDDLLDSWRKGKIRCRTAVKPVPYLDCAQELALPVGHAHFCGLFRRFLSRVSGAERRQLRAFFSKELEHKLRLGTACSGTDGIIWALKGFNQVMEVDMQCKVEANQTFALEKHPAKQLFLKTSFPELPRLFGDSCQLADGKAYEPITGVEQEGPCDLDIYLRWLPMCGCQRTECFSFQFREQGMFGYWKSSRRQCVLVTAKVPSQAPQAVIVCCAGERAWFAHCSDSHARPGLRAIQCRHSLLPSRDG